MKPRTLVSIIFVGSLATTALAHAALSGPTESHVSFQASGPAGMSIAGTTSDLTLVDKGDSIVLTVALANLSTGIGLRDRHMKEKYLEVQKHPAATLTMSRAALKLPSGGDKVEADIPTSLTLHDETRPVVVHYEIKREGAGLLARGKFRINMSDFGIPVPSYLGVTVKPDVDVTADFRASGS